MRAGRNTDQGRRSIATTRIAVAVAVAAAVTILALSAPVALGKRRLVRGTVVGQIDTVASPPVARAAGRINVLTVNGRIVTSRSVRAGHRFRFSLAPGVYLVLDADDNGPYGPCQASRVRVRARRVVRTVVYAACTAAG